MFEYTIYGLRVCDVTLSKDTKCQMSKPIFFGLCFCNLLSMSFFDFFWLVVDVLRIRGVNRLYLYIYLMCEE